EDRGYLRLVLLPDDPGRVRQVGGEGPGRPGPKVPDQVADGDRLVEFGILADLVLHLLQLGEGPVALFVDGLLGLLLDLGCLVLPLLGASLHRRGHTRRRGRRGRPADEDRTDQQQSDGCHDPLPASGRRYGTTTPDERPPLVPHSFGYGVRNGGRSASFPRNAYTRSTLKLTFQTPYWMLVTSFRVVDA